MTDLRVTVLRGLLPVLGAYVALSSCSSSTEPQLAAQLTQVSAGTLHTCGLTADGQAFCWGWNRDGQLGNDKNSDASAPQRVVGGLTFSMIAAGGGHTCALTSDGTPYCWGFNQNGQIGTAGGAHKVPVQVDGGLKFKMIAAGGSLTCGVTDSDEAYCWGWNSVGQLGNGTPGDQPAPMAVAGGLSFESVSTGSIHACGLTTTGEGYCWGSNANGELGNGTFDNSPTPVAVSGGLIFSSIDAGFNHTCGVAVGGDAYCWGNDDFGQLGNGPSEVIRQDEPSLVTGASSYSSVLAGAQYACAIRVTGVAVCWGLNTSGQLGSDASVACSIQIGVGEPTPVACNHEPIEIAGSFSFTSLAPKTQHTCAIASDGAYCWGWGEKGQLGNGRDGATYLSVEPVRVLGQS